jgi:tetratricopeptide (TPR) repeat protein
MRRLRKLTGIAFAVLGVVSHVCVQTSAEPVALADAAYKERRAKDALDYLLKAIAADPANYEALWKASRSEVDLAEVAPRGPAMDSMLDAGQRHAEAAIRLRPEDAEGHFALARVLGRRALSVGSKERVQFSKIIRAEALAALKADSTHAGALHVLGMWNAEVMRVNGLARVFARAFLGGEFLSLASWDEAQRLLEASVQHDPNRIVHRLDLAGIYADRGDKTRAREMYLWIASAPLVDPNDDLYKRQAAERNKKL